MKKFFALLVSAALLTACAPKAPAPSSGEPAAEAPAEASYVMKLGHDMQETTPQHLGAEEFKRIVEEKTGGRVEVQLFPAGQLGSDVETAEMMQTNTVQAGLVPTAKLSGLHPALQVIDLPFVFPSREACYATLDDPEFKSMLFEPMQSLGLKGLSFWESGFKQFTANKELKAPDDFKGLKFRVMESPLLIAQYEALGANPVPIDFAETYNALQQKVVDGQENPLVSITNMRFYEVQSNMTLSGHGYLAYAFLMSNDFWNSLPQDIQEIIQAAADEAAILERQITIDREAEFVQTIKDSGTAVYELSADEIQVFTQAMRPVHEAFRDKIGSDVLDKTYALLEKHAK